MDLQIGNTRAVVHVLGLLAGVSIGILGGYYIINAMTPAPPPPAAATPAATT